MFPYWVMVLKLSKIVYFLQFWAEFIKKSKFNRQLTYMHLKGLVMHFREIVLFIILWPTVSKMLRFESKKFVNFLLSQHLFDVLIANISWTVARTLINHVICWMILMRTFRCIYINCFNRLTFLAEIMQFFEQFKNHNFGDKHRN